MKAHTFPADDALAAMTASPCVAGKATLVHVAPDRFQAAGLSTPSNAQPELRPAATTAVTWPALPPWMRLTICHDEACGVAAIAAVAARPAVATMAATLVTAPRVARRVHRPRRLARCPPPRPAGPAAPQPGARRPEPGAWR